MTQLPLIFAIPRFKENEVRVDKLVNGTALETWTTSGGVTLPTFAKFLADKDAEINDEADGILAGAQAAATASAASAVEADGYADAAAVSAAQAAAVVGKTITFDSVSEFITATIPASVTTVRTNGYYAPNGLGAAKYRRITGDAQAGEQSSNGGAVRWGLVDAQYHDVCQYGARGDGSVADNAAITAMGTAKGYVRFATGALCLLTTTTIPYPMIFDVDSGLTTEETLTITNRITSPKQHIFQGNGNYIINISGSIGEDAKVVHASWWGVFPTNSGNVDHAPAIRKIFAALAGQTREGVVLFDNGSYHVHSSMTVPRGTHVKGEGTRRTIFDVSGSGYDVFVTGGVACKFSDFQFEQPSDEVLYRTGSLIRLAHDNCEVDNIWLWNSEIGVRVDARDCYVTKIRGTYGVTMPAGTAAVQLNSNAAYVNDVRILSTGGPTAIVEIGKQATANIGQISVNNIQTTGPSIPILVDTNQFIVSGLTVSGASFNGSGGTTTEAIVKLKTSGSGGINGVAIDQLHGNSLCDNLLKIEQGSSGTTENIIIDDSVLRSGGASAFNFSKTAGTLRDVTFGEAIEAQERTDFLVQSGTMSGMRLPTRQSGLINGRVTVADDAAVSIKTPFVGGFCALTFEGTSENSTFPAESRSAIVFYDTGGSTQIAKVSAGGADVNVVNTDVTGATGVDTKITIGAIAGNIRLENRSGGTGVWRYSFY